MIAIPDELWMLEILSDETGEPTGEWCLAMDDPDDADNYLVCLTEADAIASAEYQDVNYSMKCRPVRVK